LPASEARCVGGPGRSLDPVHNELSCFKTLHKPYRPLYKRGNPPYFRQGICTSPCNNVSYT